MAVIGNMHINARVIEVTELNSEVRSDIRGQYHCRPLVFRAIALLFRLNRIHYFLNSEYVQTLFVNEKTKQSFLIRVHVLIFVTVSEV